MRQTPRLAYTVGQTLESGTFSSRNKLYDAIASGKLRSFRDGKRRMISADALQEYITRRERETAEGVGLEKIVVAKAKTSKIAKAEPRKQAA